MPKFLCDPEPRIFPRQEDQDDNGSREPVFFTVRSPTIVIYIAPNTMINRVNSILKLDRAPLVSFLLYPVDRPFSISTLLRF